MGKKHKKSKNSSVVSYESQQEALNMADELLLASLRGESVPSSVMNLSDDSYQDYAPPADIGDEIAAAVAERRRERELEKKMESEPFMVPRDAAGNKIDVSDIIMSSSDDPDEEMLKLNKKLEEMMERYQEDPEPEYVNPPVEESSSSQELEAAMQRMEMHRVTFHHIETDSYNVVFVFDGVRMITIDVNTLNEDEFALPESGLYNPMTISFMRLEEILPYLYPGIIMSKNRLEAHLRHVSEYDDDRFKFFEYPDGNNNLVVGYFIEDKQSDAYVEICAKMADRHCLVSFLNALMQMTCIPGMAFNNIHPEHLKQLMLTKDVERSSNKFLEFFMKDEDTTVDEKHFNDSIDSVIRILPFNYMDAEIDAILNPESDEEEFEGTPVVNIPEDEPEEEEREEEEGEEASAEESSLFDGVEGAESAVEEEEDPEQAEKDYYASKGQKPPQPQKPKPKKTDDDGINWKIPRR